MEIISYFRLYYIQFKVVKIVMRAEDWGMGAGGWGPDVRAG